jgi:transcriptional regulator with XRE-family HTH domain
MRQGHVINPGDQWVGAVLREARLQAGYTQYALATRLGWSPDTLASYETGRRGLRAAQLVEVAQALGLPPTALLSDDPQIVAVLRQLGTSTELWGQVRLFLEALEAHGKAAGGASRGEGGVIQPVGE